MIQEDESSDGTVILRGKGCGEAPFHIKLRLYVEASRASFMHDFLLTPRS